jgi:AbrB family looped-hinge helix DNA binding protein
METTLTERGQTAIPAKIRKRFGLKARQKLMWVEDGQVIYVLPVATDPIAAFRRSGKASGLSAALLKSRREDAHRGA